jgi:hypothetical protein
MTSGKTTKLTWFHLVGTKVKDAGVARLQAALPKTTINR